MGKIWAVARNTISQAVRMKIAIGFSLLLLIILPILSFIVTGDGTLKGKLQTFITYGMGLMNLMLCILVIVVSSFTLSFDLKRSLLYTVVTKPIRRFELFIGKVLGLVVVGFVLLVIFAGLIYGLTVYMPKMGKVTEKDLAVVNNEFFTARAELTPIPIDVEAIAEKYFDSLEKENKLPKDALERYKLKNRILKTVKSQSFAVVPGTNKIWRFEGLYPEDRDASIFIRYKFQASSPPPDNMIVGYWTVGDLRPAQLGQSVNPFQVARKDKIKTVYEVELPAEYVADDGHLDIVYENHYMNRTTLLFDEPDFKVLYKSDTFTMNFIRCCLVIFARIIFFSVLGVVLSTWLSFPVVVLINLVVFFTGSISGFIFTSFNYVESAKVIFELLKAIMYLFPKFDGANNPTEFMLGGTLLSWQMLGWIYLKLVVLKSTLAALGGMVIFSRREIAKISV